MEDWARWRLGSRPELPPPAVLSAAALYFQRLGLKALVVEHQWQWNIPCPRCPAKFVFERALQEVPGGLGSDLPERPGSV